MGLEWTDMPLVLSSLSASSFLNCKRHPSLLSLHLSRPVALSDNQKIHEY